MDNESLSESSPLFLSTVATDIQTREVAEDWFRLNDFIFNCCLTQIFAIFAFCGTSINIVVLSSYDLSKDSSAVLLLALSVADLIFCFTLPIRRCQCLVTQMQGWAAGVTAGTLMTETMFIFNRIFYCISISLVGVIAFERLIAVFLPFQAHRLLSPKNMKIAAVMTYLVNIFINSPGFYMFKHDWTLVEGLNQSVAVLQLSDFYVSNYDNLNFFIMIVYNTGVLGASMVCTLIFMVAIGIKIWTMTKKRQTLVRNKEFRFDPQLAKVLLIICLVSLILHGPSIFFDTVAYFMPNFINQSKMYEAYETLVDFSGALSAAINFLVYMTMSKKFKHRYKDLFRCCLSFLFKKFNKH
ncbi:somatostatin receptor type 5 [Biomphalaria glabrata]|nr:somatostatin receptor type 5-like; partial [Biomphalaria glabrata]